MIGRAILPLVAGCVALAYFSLLRGYPPSLAVIMATAIGALTWAVGRTTERLRRLRAEREDDDQPPSEQ